MIRWVAYVLLATGGASAALFTGAYAWLVRRPASATSHYLLLSAVAGVAMLGLFAADLVWDWPSRYVLSALVGAVCTGSFVARLVLLARAPGRKGGIRSGQDS